MNRVARLMAAAAAVCACGDSAAPSDTTMEPPMAALYEVCDGYKTCMEGSCVELAVGGSLCTVECSADDECPAGPASSVGVLCDLGHCLYHNCFSSTPVVRVASDRVCIHGEITECDSLSERPCECGCDAGTGCNPETLLCMPVLALDEHCQKDYECATGYCGTKIDGYKSLCKKPPGASCDPTLRECDALCTAPPGATEGYCLQYRVHVCGSNSCPTTCADPHFMADDGAICRQRCQAATDCKDWEDCKYAALTDSEGLCIPRP